MRRVGRAARMAVVVRMPVVVSMVVVSMDIIVAGRMVVVASVQSVCGLFRSSGHGAIPITSEVAGPLHALKWLEGQGL